MVYRLDSFVNWGNIRHISIADMIKEKKGLGIRSIVSIVSLRSVLVSVLSTSDVLTFFKYFNSYVILIITNKNFTEISC